MAVTNYGLYFSKRGTTIRIPVNPQEYPIKSPGDNTRYNVLNIGEIIVPRIPKLKQTSWESYFPGDPDDSLSVIGNGFKPPEFYIDTFNEYQSTGEPVRFIANRYMENGDPIFDTNMLVIVEDFDYREKGGETGDFYYTISLSEYRDFSPQRVTTRTSDSNGTGNGTTVLAATSEQRKTPTDVITIGDKVTANGRYFYTSWGESPFDNANNITTTVTRIIQSPGPGQIYPVLIGQLGWVQMSQLKKV